MSSVQRDRAPLAATAFRPGRQGDLLCGRTAAVPAHSSPRVTSWGPTPTDQERCFMTVPAPDFKVADLSLAAFGRKEIQLAEHEMPGLMAMRREFGPQQALRGARITGSLHMTIQ